MSGMCVMWMGAKAPSSDLVAFGGSISASATGAVASATITLTSAGVVTPAMSTSGSESVGTQWGPTSGSSWWVLATLTTGSSPTSGTVGTWLSLASNQSWSYIASSVGTVSGTLRFDFALSSGGAIQGSSTVSFTATRT